MGFLANLSGNFATFEREKDIPKKRNKKKYKRIARMKKKSKRTNYKKNK